MKVHQTHLDLAQSKKKVQLCLERAPLSENAAFLCPVYRQCMIKYLHCRVAWSCREDPAHDIFPALTVYFSMAGEGQTIALPHWHFHHAITRDLAFLSLVASIFIGKDGRDAKLYMFTVCSAPRGTWLFGLILHCLLLLLILYSYTILPGRKSWSFWSLKITGP